MINRITLIGVLIIGTPIANSKYGLMRLNRMVLY